MLKTEKQHHLFSYHVKQKYLYPPGFLNLISHKTSYLTVKRRGILVKEDISLKVYTVSYCRMAMSLISNMLAYLSN